MADEDWYRQTRWNDRIEQAFFERLSRTRSQRDQYLVIQATTLSVQRPDVTLRLVDRYFDTKTSDFEDVRALLARAEAYRSQKKIVETVQAYKDVLRREAEFPKHQTATYLELPYFIANQSLSAEYSFALTVLEKGAEELPFPVDKFRWHASKALIAAAQNGDAEARTHARQALDAAQVRKSGFRYHQNIGLVGKEHQAVIKRLVKLAG